MSLVPYCTADERTARWVSPCVYPVRLQTAQVCSSVDTRTTCVRIWEINWTMTCIGDMHLSRQVLRGVRGRLTPLHAHLFCRAVAHTAICPPIELQRTLRKHQHSWISCERPLVHLHSNEGRHSLHTCGVSLFEQTAVVVDGSYDATQIQVTLELLDVKALHMTPAQPPCLKEQHGTLHWSSYVMHTNVL